MIACLALYDKGGMLMRRKQMILIAITILALVSLGIYGSLYGEHSNKSLEDILTIDFSEVTKIELSNLTGDYRSTEDKNEIYIILNYLNQFQYKRLLNDQTAYMPNRASIVYIYNNDESNFIVPYEHEAMINHKVYQIRDGIIEQAVLLDMFETLNDTSFE